MNVETTSPGTLRKSKRTPVPEMVSKSFLFLLLFTIINPMTRESVLNATEGYGTISQEEFKTC